MKVYKDKYVIQTTESPIQFLGFDDMVEDIDEATFFTTKEEADETIKGKTGCKVIDLEITYRF